MLKNGVHKRETSPSSHKPYSPLSSTQICGKHRQTRRRRRRRRRGKQNSLRLKNQYAGAAAGHLYATCEAGLGEPETGVRKAKVNFIHQLPSAYFFPQECRGLCAGLFFFFSPMLAGSYFTEARCSRDLI